MNIIKIVGASTLKRYTEGILEKGFINNLWVVDDNNPDLILYQIHGAPSAAIDDKDIISKLKLDLSQDDKHIVILLHRPDEIQDRHPELSAILKNAKNKFGLVFFGGFHLNDNFYDSNKAIKTIIPHGFFDLEPIEIKDQIIIGTHTTWGEMRSVKHVVKLMEEIFKLNKNGNVIGYIGGKPAEELDIEKLCKLYSINFELAENYNPNADYFNENVVFVDNLNIQPTDLDITFNTQLYYYKNGIRTGESSGSAHTSASVPVVLEMNDAENVENLKVIKIPYGSKDDIESIDFASGARSISELIQSGEYKEWLDHNFEQSRKINNTFIAGEYIKLFKTLVSYK